MKAEEDNAWSSLKLTQLKVSWSFGMPFVFYAANLATDYLTNHWTFHAGTKELKSTYFHPDANSKMLRINKNIST